MNKLHSPEAGPVKLEEIGRNVTYIPEPGQLEAMQGLTIVDAVSDPSVNLGDEIRGAVQLYINSRRNAPGFEAEVQAAKARQEERALEMFNHEPQE